MQSLLSHPDPSEKLGRKIDFSNSASVEAWTQSKTIVNTQSMLSDLSLRSLLQTGTPGMPLTSMPSALRLHRLHPVARRTARP